MMEVFCACCLYKSQHGTTCYVTLFTKKALSSDLDPIPDAFCTLLPVLSASADRTGPDLGRYSIDTYGIQIPTFLPPIHGGGSCGTQNLRPNTCCVAQTNTETCQWGSGISPLTRWGLSFPRGARPGRPTAWGAGRRSPACPAPVRSTRGSRWPLPPRPWSRCRFRQGRRGRRPGGRFFCCWP